MARTNGMAAQHRWPLGHCITHRDDVNFSSGPWSFIHSPIAQGDKFAGVAVLVHRRFCTSPKISHKTLAQGRVQHGPPACGQNSVDVLNIYQHVWRGSGSDEATIARRQQIWRAVRKGVHSSPQRNTLIIGGDMNTSLATFPPHVGSSVITKDVRQPDPHELVAVMQDYGLTALNTWGAEKAKTYTCITGDATS